MVRKAGMDVALSNFPVGFGLLLEGLSARHASGVVLVIAGRVLSMAIDVVRREEGDGV